MTSLDNVVVPITFNVPPTTTLLSNLGVLISTFCPAGAVNVIFEFTRPVIVLPLISIAGSINGLAAIILPELTVPNTALPVKL